MLAALALVGIACTKELPEGAQTPQEQHTLNAKLVGGSDGELVPGAILIKLESSVPEEGLLDGTDATIRRAIPVEPKNKAAFERYGLDRWFLVEFDETVRPEVVAEKIAARKDVKAIQYSRMLQPSWNESDVFPMDMQPVTRASQKSVELPFNDTYLEYQWNLFNDGSIHQEALAGADVGVKDAWRLCAGDPSVVVAVFDLGINHIHEDLRDALWVNEGETRGNGKDDDGNGFIDDYNGFNFFRYNTLEDGTIKSRYGIDCTKGSGHGTHVAGIIGAVNNNGKGVSSIAGGTGNKDGVRLMSCQIFYGDNGAKGTDQEAATGFIYAADNGACIAQCSWGHTSEILKHDQDYIDSAPLEYAALQYYLDPENSNHSALKGNIAVFS